jgi:hypothetical protein
MPVNAIDAAALVEPPLARGLRRHKRDGGSETRASVDGGDSSARLDRVARGRHKVASGGHHLIEVGHGEHESPQGGGDASALDQLEDRAAGSETVEPLTDVTCLADPAESLAGERLDGGSGSLDRVSGDDDVVDVAKTAERGLTTLGGRSERHRNPIAG